MPGGCQSFHLRTEANAVIVEAFLYPYVNSVDKTLPVKPGPAACQ